MCVVGKVLMNSCWSRDSSGCVRFFFFFFKQKTAYEMRISDWSSDVCSSDLDISAPVRGPTGFQLIQLIDTREAGRQKITEYKARHLMIRRSEEIGRASCRERVCQYV